MIRCISLLLIALIVPASAAEITITSKKGNEVKVDAGNTMPHPKEPDVLVVTKWPTEISTTVSQKPATDWKEIGFSPDPAKKNFDGDPTTTLEITSSFETIARDPSGKPDEEESIPVTIRMPIADAVFKNPDGEEIGKGELSSKGAIAVQLVDDEKDPIWASITIPPIDPSALKGDYQFSWNADLVEVFEDTDATKSVKQGTNYDATQEYTFYVRGKAASSKLDDASFAVKWTDGTQTIEKADEILLTVVRLEMTLFQPGTKSSPGAKIPRPEEKDDKYVAILSANLDDDDGRSTDSTPKFDGDDEELGATDNDLVQIELKIEPPGLDNGSIDVTITPTAIRAFTSDGTVIKPEELTVDLANPTGPLAKLAKEPVKIFVEGMEAHRVVETAKFAFSRKDEIAKDEGVLLPFEMTLHRRGTINVPGASINRPADADAVYEVVTLENADWEEQENWNPNSMASAAEANRQDGATEAVNLDRDDDFVKIKLHCPVPRMAGSIELVMDRPGQGDRMQADHLRFYDDQGNRIQLADLKIKDLQNPTGPLVPMLEEDGLDLFVEIADLGMLTRAATDANRNQLRYSDLILRMNLAGQVTELKGRVYRGGYWLNQRNANAGSISFYDGKGRYRDEDGQWQIDVGNPVHGPYPIQSGQPGEPNHTVPNRGPTPPGWYGLYERLDINPNWQQIRGRWVRPQQDHNYAHPSGGQRRPPLQDATGQYWQQGSYSQWAAPGNRTAVTHRGASTPASIQFKFQLVEAYEFTTRSELQIHPDGWSDGTAGCVGLQTYDDCCRIFFLLRHYYGTMLHVETP